MSKYTPDIYNISNTVNTIQKKHMKDISEDTLYMGTFGYLNEIHSNAIQNSILMASEWGNEAFPIRCKFEKTVLTNAVTYNVENLNATPAKMHVMIGFIKEELDSNMEKDIFILDKNCKIKIGEFEYHLDYDIIITKDHLVDTVYSARYDIKRPNPISDIKSPYLEQPPVILRMDNDDFVFISCVIRQVEEYNIYKKIITNNILENKSFDFSFDKQLASFEVVVKDGDNEIYLTPIFEGMPLNGNAKYCFYNYLDKNTIRVKFDRSSYEPRINCDVVVAVKNTKGSKGNFIYKDDIIVTLKSDKYTYKNLSMLVKPVTSSVNGIDRKSIKELKEIIPKEILSRGNITNNKDLENFFNNMIDYNNRLKFFRRRDNQIERLYYAYMLVKDNDDNVIPTNTINLKLSEKDFDKFEDDRYILNPGNVIRLDKDNQYGLINRKEIKDMYKEECDNFIYSSPFTLVVNKNPLSISYYLNQINRDYRFKFSYINNATMQFMATSMHCYRNYIDHSNYKLSLSLIQTLNVDKKLVKSDAYGNVLDSNIVPILVLSIDSFKYYVKGNVLKFDKSNFKYDVEFEIESDNIINKENKIKINNIYSGGTTNKTHIYLNDKVEMSVYVLTKFSEDEGVIPNQGEIKGIVPGLDEYTLCNKYDTLEPVNLFYNYSHVIKSKVRVYKKEGDYMFNIEGVPLVRYSYLNDVERCDNFIDYVQYRKAYIDAALNVIENSFSVDLKFFNTYGPSKTIHIGYDGQYLDKVNLTFNFKLKLYTGADKQTKKNIMQEIKMYIENINNSDISSIHISNLITDISNKFKNDIKFIEFAGINDFNSTYQYLEKKETNIIEQVPEFLNINLTKDLKPDINIILV